VTDSLEIKGSLAPNILTISSRATSVIVADSCSPAPPRTIARASSNDVYHRDITRLRPAVGLSIPLCLASIPSPIRSTIDDKRSTQMAIRAGR